MDRRPEITERWHSGDPCVYCGLAHDEVTVGDCQGPDDIRLLFDELHAKQYAITAHWGKPQVRSDMRRCATVTQALVLTYGLTGRQITAELRRRDAQAALDAVGGV